MNTFSLRRHLSLLVFFGLIFRRDSPNGKRYARRGEGGEIEEAFGFDLSPLVARAVEFKRQAAGAIAAERQLHALRDRITICRRDIDKMIATGLYEEAPADWRAFSEGRPPSLGMNLRSRLSPSHGKIGHNAASPCLWSSALALTLPSMRPTGSTPGAI